MTTGRAAKGLTNCEMCAQDGKFVTAETIDGDDYGLQYRCPECGHEGWIRFEEYQGA
jgi:uncharacterized Zn finger protein